ncbi:OBAP family protein [Rhodopila sp.]|uniref:OBAP family protein n=1 Tax=Rhodopila sp. TaxID=2480087 RepID=UPI003D0D939B
MAPAHDAPSPHGSAKGLFGSISVGVAAGVAAASAVLLGRKAITTASVGQGHPLKHRILDVAAGAMQHKYPLDAMSTFLNGFHFYADDMGRQVEACHFCTHLRHDLHQCVIFDSNTPTARLIGIEYIISEHRFRGLPDEEKRLWHSHHFEVKSGELVAPGIPELAERTYFKDLVTTYGKTFHNWQVDKHDFPYGIPQLMMGFTEDGQINQGLAEDRDRRYGISTGDRRRKRAGIPMPVVVPGANVWESGGTVQTRLEEMDFKR